LDRVNPRTGVSDCPRVAYLCNDSVYFTLMTEQCPRTCNRCPETGNTALPPTCVDRVNPRTGVSDCPKRAYLCKNSVYFTLMTELTDLPHTRDLEHVTCLDRVNPRTGVSDCPGVAYLCNDSVYFTLMTEQCPRTCNRCPETGNTALPPTCVDRVNPRTGVSDCPKRAYLCNNSVYFTLMTEQCPMTCNRCPGAV
uniref:ShTK domain protein n=1 Tax=Angiostrongylus cantonensis TaxID=6313 RepID=A0A0K0D057_ANGCA